MGVVILLVGQIAGRRLWGRRLPQHKDVQEAFSMIFPMFAAIALLVGVLWSFGVFERAPAILPRDPIETEPSLWWKDQEFDASIDGPLTEEDLAEFQKNGCVALSELLEPDLFTSLTEEIQENVWALLARMVEADMLSKGIELKQERSGWTPLALSIRKAFIEKSEFHEIWNRQIHFFPSLERILTHPKLLGAARQLGLKGKLAVHPHWDINLVPTGHRFPNSGIFRQDTSLWPPRMWSKPALSFWIPMFRNMTKHKNNHGNEEFWRTSHTTGKTVKHVAGMRGRWFPIILGNDLRMELLNGTMHRWQKYKAVPGTLGSVVLYLPTLAHKTHDNRSRKEHGFNLSFRIHAVEDDVEDIRNTFWGLQESVVIEEDGSADFTKWKGQEQHFQTRARQWLGESEIEAGSSPEPPGPFNPILPGPWLDTWDIQEVTNDVEAYLSLSRVEKELKQHKAKLEATAAGVPYNPDQSDVQEHSHIPDEL